MLWVGITNGGLARACVSLRAVLRVNYSLSGRIAVLFLASQLTIVSLDVAIYYNYISWSKLTSLHIQSLYHITINICRKHSFDWRINHL